MRLWILPILVLAVASCTRPSAGVSFQQLLLAASDGLREYESWVERDKDDVPNRLCLAGIHISASLAEKTGASASLGLPLAAPAFGLSGMLGYKFIASESETGTISATLAARYQLDPEELENPRTDFENFIKSIPALYASKRDDLTKGTLKEPPTLADYADRERPPFRQRRDLAAELWRIRQAIHGAVLSSPTNFVLEPGPMTLRIGYVAQVSTSGRVTINLGGQPTGDFGVGSGTTEENEMILFYVKNEAKTDVYTCNDESVPESKLDSLVQAAKINVKPAAPPPPPE